MSNLQDKVKVISKHRDLVLEERHQLQEENKNLKSDQNEMLQKHKQSVIMLQDENERMRDKLQNMRADPEEDEANDFLIKRENDCSSSFQTLNILKEEYQIREQCYEHLLNLAIYHIEDYPKKSLLKKPLQRRRSSQPVDFSVCC